MAEVPTIVLAGLSDAQERSLRLADNKIALGAGWDLERQSQGPAEVRKEARPSAFDIVFDKTLTVTQGGSERALTVEEALQLRTYQDAIAGNRPARREIPEDDCQARALSRGAAASDRRRATRGPHRVRTGQRRPGAADPRHRGAGPQPAYSPPRRSPARALGGAVGAQPPPWRPATEREGDGPNSPGHARCREPARAKEQPTWPDRMKKRTGSAAAARR